MPDPRPTATLLTGIPEFDVVLRGGLPLHRLHLIEGAPGTGKTTIAVRFLLERSPIELNRLGFRPRR